jgi:hypothetical protein
MGRGVSDVWKPFGRPPRGDSFPRDIARARVNTARAKRRTMSQHETPNHAPAQCSWLTLQRMNGVILNCFDRNRVLNEALAGDIDRASLSRNYLAPHKLTARARRGLRTMQIRRLLLALMSARSMTRGSYGKAAREQVAESFRNRWTACPRRPRLTQRAIGEHLHPIRAALRLQRRSQCFILMGACSSRVLGFAPHLAGFLASQPTANCRSSS